MVVLIVEWSLFQGGLRAGFYCIQKPLSDEFNDLIQSPYTQHGRNIVYLTSNFNTEKRLYSGYVEQVDHTIVSYMTHQYIEYDILPTKLYWLLYAD